MGRTSVASVSPLTSPLHDRHVAAGAKLADFSGWSMPIEYAGGGVLAEHAAVRSAVSRPASMTASGRPSCSSKTATRPKWVL